MDSSCFVFDVVDGAIVDLFRFEHSPAVCVDFHPDGRYLVTAHSSCEGLYLWTNKLFFGGCFLRSPPQSIDEAPILRFPVSYASSISTQAIQESVSDDFSSTKKGDDLDHLDTDDSLFSFSGLPFSRWRSISVIDSIKVSCLLTLDKTNIRAIRISLFHDIFVLHTSCSHLSFVGSE